MAAQLAGTRQNFLNDSALPLIQSSFPKVAVSSDTVDLRTIVGLVKFNFDTTNFYTLEI